MRIFLPASDWDCGFILISWFIPPFMIFVLSIPPPLRVIAFVIIRVLFHVAVPAGIMTMSPELDLDTAAFTSWKDGLAAVRVFAAMHADVSYPKQSCLHPSSP